MTDTTTTATTDLATTVNTALDQLKASTGSLSLKGLVRNRVQRSLLLVDCSGSMSSTVKTGKRKIDVLREVVKDLRETHPVPVAAFGHSTKGATVEVVDMIPEPHGSTMVHKAILFGKQEGATHLVLVTDGFPDSESYAFAAAREFGGPIDVFYIGDGGDSGAEFAKQLAALTGGTANVTDLGAPKQLTSKIAGLLGSGESL
jgi:translation initiation factor 2B subunit (eIF-2B alpha/beta/delta family)